GHTEFIVAAREGTKRCILRVLQNEGDVPGRVQVGDKLHVKAQRKVSEFLQLGGRQRIRFNDGRGALVLKVPLELDGESIDLEKCRLLYSALQYFEMLEMMGVVPVYHAQSNIGPIYYLAFREPETTVSRTNELDKCLHTVKEPGRSVGRDFQTPRAQGQAVPLFNKPSLVEQAYRLTLGQRSLKIGTHAPAGLAYCVHTRKQSLRTRAQC